MEQPIKTYDDMEEELIEHGRNAEADSVDSLTWMARAVRSLNKQIDIVNNYESNEMAKLNDCCGHKRIKLQEQIDGIMNRASNFLKSEEYGHDSKRKKLHLPGVGTFKFGSSRESVDDNEYKALSKELQIQMQEELPHLFTRRESVTIAPDKTAIKEKIIEGNDVAGFILREKKETFKFDAE